MTNATLSNSAALADGKKEFLSRAREHGRAIAAGSDAWPNIALETVEAASLGYISPDDAKAIYDDVISAYSKRLVHSDNGKGAGASKLKSIITLGCMTTVDGVKALQDAALEHAKMRKEGLKPQAAYAGFVSVARAQIASPRVQLGASDLRAALMKVEKEKTARDFVADAVKDLEKALAVEGLSADEKAGVEAALAKAGEVIGLMDQAAARAAKLEQLAALQAELGL